MTSDNMKNVFIRGFFNGVADSLFQGPYVPPCERKPYYNDPRDVGPGAHQAVSDFFNNYCANDVMATEAVFHHLHGDWRSEPIEPATELERCRKCGTYFARWSPFRFDICQECAKEES